MGILVDNVKKAFGKLRQGDSEGFIYDIHNVSDVRWANHAIIVRNAIEDELKKLDSEGLHITICEKKK